VEGATATADRQRALLDGGLVLAVAGPLAYVLWPEDLTWWLAPVPAIPLCLLAEWRHERKGFQTEPYGGPVDGAFTWRGVLALGGQDGA
jgi:hypothetical protein